MISNRIVSISILSVLLLAMSFTLYSCFNVSSGEIYGGKDRVALLRIEGVITSGEAAGSFFGATGAHSDSIISALREAIEDDSIKALVVRVNSPGGSAAASEEIFNALMEVKDAGKPIIVSMADVAASGGYFVSAPADFIFANATTLTGSIGVIMEIPNFEGLFELLGVNMRTFKAGEFKDIGSAYRPMTDAEKAMLEALLADTHEVFMSYVAQGRQNLDIEQVRTLATGQIWSGNQALEVGLIDGIGGLRAAILKAAELAGIEGEPVIEELGKTNILDEILGIEQAGVLPIPTDRFSFLARFMYLQPLLVDERFSQIYR